VEKFSLFILTNFEDHGIQPITHPADSPILFCDIRSLIEPIRAGEQFLRFLEPDPAPRIGSEPLALSGDETKAHG
jgi:hypothetical protein